MPSPRRSGRRCCRATSAAPIRPAPRRRRAGARKAAAASCRRACAGRGPGPVAAGRVRFLRLPIPALVGQVGAERQPCRARTLARGNLEHVAIVVVVVPDHVQDKGADHAHRGRVPGAAVFRGQAQAAFHQRLGQVPRAQTIRRELLAGQVHQPNVAFQLPARASGKKTSAASQQGCGRRVVVVRAGCGRTQSVPAARWLEDILHVGRVVVVGHDHRLGAVAAGNDQHDVALVRLALLIPRPRLRPREIEFGAPVEAVIEHLGASLHAVALDGFAIAMVQVLAQSDPGRGACQPRPGPPGPLVRRFSSG